MRSIAIDGPSGAGKSTISRRLARDLGFLYVDTGAMYRVVGLYALRHPETPIAEALENIRMDMRYQDGLQRMYLNGEDVTDAIRRHEVCRAASDVSALPGVRAFLLDRQRSFAKTHDVIMDGRDIGTVILPDADIKIFLTADAEDRARRRYDELCARGTAPDYQTVLSDLRKRDYNDAHRAAAPLTPAAGAVIVDTTGNTFEESVRALKRIIRKKLRL
ncbi:MAG: (d)CMP kinase [Oscillospiraceae bacterium]|nr:(d)CMP kinase [Oscillospiraceae bacterium]